MLQTNGWRERGRETERERGREREAEVSCDPLNWSDWLPSLPAWETAILTRGQELNEKRAGRHVGSRCETSQSVQNWSETNIPGAECVPSWKINNQCAKTPACQSVWMSQKGIRFRDISWQARCQKWLAVTRLSYGALQALEPRNRIKTRPLAWLQRLYESSAAGLHGVAWSVIFFSRAPYKQKLMRADFSRPTLFTSPPPFLQLSRTEILSLSRAINKCDCQ